MLGRLKQSHFAIIPAEAYIPLQPGPGSRDGAPGLDVRLIDGRVLVTTVEGDSPAARAGIKPGWEIVAIEGKDVAPMVESDPLVCLVDQLYSNDGRIELTKSDNCLRVRGSFST